MVVVSGTSDPDTILEALDLGAKGFIPKTSTRDVLLDSVRLVASGGIYVPVEALKARGGKAEGDAPGAGAARSAAELGLTGRQRDVLVLKGLPNKLIARKLDLAENTVKVHVRAVLQALDVSTRTQALIAATRLGLRLENL